jgi:hypothetical protein
MQYAYGTVDASTSEAGTILSNHSYPTTYAASYRIELSVRLKFFRRSLHPGSTAQVAAILVKAIDQEEHKDILLSGDVEENPGPEESEDSDESSSDEDAADEPN